jgi:hypothetical protein
MTFEINSIKNKNELFFFSFHPFASFAAYILSPRTFSPLVSIILHYKRGDYNRGHQKTYTWLQAFGSDFNKKSLFRIKPLSSLKKK